MIEYTTPYFDCLEQRIYFGPDPPDDGDFFSIEVKRLEAAREQGETHPDFLKLLDGLARSYAMCGRYAAAEPLLREHLQTTQKLFGSTDPRYAGSLDNLATLYHRMGDYASAERLYLQALEVDHADETAQSKGTFPQSAFAHRNLAQLYTAMGKYAAAEPLMRQDLRRARSSKGPIDPDFAYPLIDLGMLSQLMGDYPTARRLFRRALNILLRGEGGKHYGKYYPEFPDLLHKLAMLDHKCGNLVAAERLYRRALKSWRCWVEPSHAENRPPHYRNPLQAVTMSEYFWARNLLLVPVLNNLGMLYQGRGDHRAAVRLYRRALTTLRRSGLTRHPDFAAVLHSLASLYHDLGEYARAEPLYRRALAIQRRTLGKDHPHVASCLFTLAGLHIATGRAEAARHLMEESVAIEDRLIGQVFSIGSERGRTQFLQKVHGELAGFLSLVVRHLAPAPAAVGAGFELVLRRKAIRAEALAAQRDAVLSGHYPALAAPLRRLTALQSEITHKTLAGTESPRRLARLQAAKDRLEASLARQIPEMDLRQKLRAADRGALAAALPAGSALIEFVRFSPVDFLARPALGESPRKPARYLAFVLRAGAPDDLRMIDLGEADPIDQLIAAARAMLASAGAHRDLVKEPDAVNPPPIREAGIALRAAIFDPLVEVLQGNTRLYMAPDGELNKVPFGVLPAARGGYLIDLFRFSYLTSGREVLELGRKVADPATEDLVIADPDFDAAGFPADPPGPAPVVSSSATQSVPGLDARPGAAETGPLASGLDRTTLPPRPPGRQSRDLDQKALRFERLPGTSVEGERVARLLNVRPWLHGEALEGRLKARRSPRILHLATHGFFLEDQELANPRQPKWQAEPGPERLAGPGLENPLLRSGLALSGANTWLRRGVPPAEAEDGLLTAEDVSGLDLQSTELVVLSACQTGLGEIHVGEGVFGLRRAFALAGARTLVISLWRVPDLATAFLMERFYHSLSGTGLDRDLALREAQRATRDVTVGQLRGDWLSDRMIDRLAAGDAAARRALQELAQQPDGHRPFEHPFYWGAFICQGDTAPLPVAARASG
jgi:CHAT domain-containing protein/tetratricopeptide (TPR) repeat protein